MSGSLANTMWIAASARSKPSFDFICAIVSSGFLASNAFSSASCAGISLALLPQNRYLGRNSPVRLYCCTSFFTKPSGTMKCLATPYLVLYFALSSTILSRKSSDMVFLIVPYCSTFYLL
jgi:hypothetical protein